MTDIELKKLKDDLWHSADMLHAGAHLAANKYGQPILGFIFLRYADVLIKQHQSEIENEYNRHKGTRIERAYKDIAVEKCGFFLPECAYFDTINDAPDDANKAVLVKKAMEAIEDENPKLKNVCLPSSSFTKLISTKFLKMRFPTSLMIYDLPICRAPSKTRILSVFVFKWSSMYVSIFLYSMIFTLFNNI